MITIENCLKVCDNPFDLVLLASERTKQLASGARPLVDKERDKYTVIALREISEGYVEFDNTEEDAF